MKQKYKFLPIYVLIVIFLLASCQSETESILTTSPTVAIATATPISQPTLTLTTTSLPLSIATATKIGETVTAVIPTPIKTITTGIEVSTTLSVTTSPIPSEILTPLPTISDGEIESAIKELVESPMKCDVPCLWGALPGKTTVLEVQQFLTQFGFIDLQSNDPEHIEIRIYHNETSGQAYFYVRYSFEDGVLKIVFSEKSPPLYEVLRKHGRPDEVWLTVVDFEGLLVRLNLVYLQKGMAVGFVVDGSMQDNLVKGCFADEETGLLRLVEPNTATSYKEFRPIFDSDRLYLPLEEAATLTMSEFMQQFSDPTQSQCIETPIELWE